MISTFILDNFKTQILQLFQETNLIVLRLNSSTGLPEGTYCNLVDDCSTTVSVLADGSAQITINNVEEPMVAICIGGGTTLEPECEFLYLANLH
jgi:hypothetical protein